MDTIKNYLFIILVFIGIIFSSCESEINKPLKTDDAVPPQVTNVKVENLPGAAKITYALPNDPNVLCVLVTYMLPNGQEMRTKSSVYKSYVELEGFSVDKEYTVYLYTVSRAEVVSEPVEVKIHPTKAPIRFINETLNIIATFGGINLKFENPLALEFVLHTHYKDSTNTWTEYDRYYSDAREVSYSVRGLENTPTEFRVFFTDKWQNSTDTTYVELTPLFEEIFDKTIWKDAALADDSNVARYGPLSELWTPGTNTYFFIKSDMPGLVLPNWWTIDLGKKYQFGRMLVNNVSHADTWMYARGTPEVFEIWGANEKTTDWNKWTLLGEFNCVKPSGLPLGQVNQADRDQCLAGDSYDFEASAESYRYVRFKTVKTFGNIPDVYLLELTFYGQAVN